MRDQAYKLRMLARHRMPLPVTNPGGPRVIAITSGKGGVGKTNLAVNLGLALARTGKRVVLFDADLGLSNGEVLLGVTPRFNLYDVLYADKEMSDIVTKVAFNMRLVSGGSGIQGLADLKRTQRAQVVQMLNYFCDSTDYLLIDTGAGLTKNVLGFVAAAQEVIVVVTPEPTSLTDGYSMIKVLSRYRVHEKVYLVVNRVRGEAEAIQTARKIRLVAGKFLNVEIRHIGWVGDDPAVPRAVRNQQPFMLAEPEAQPSRNVEALAQFFTKGDRQTTGPDAVKGFLARLFRLFG